MLETISIKNFAIIEAVSLQFDQGMTVLSGETGAGKSIIIDAMNLILGGRSNLDMIRHGAAKAEIEGLFSLAEDSPVMTLLADKGIDVTDDQVIIRRDLMANGRSVSRINGQLVNLSLLRDIGRYLVDIHGQHDQEELMRPAYHLGLLDSFGDASFLELKNRYQAVFDAYRQARQRLQTLRQNEASNKERVALLNFQISEIEAVDLKDGEEDDLTRRLTALQNHKKIADTLSNAYQLLDAEDFSSLGNVRDAMGDLQELESYDAEYKRLGDSLADAYYVLEDVTRSLEDAVDRLEFDSEELLLVQARLDVVNSLIRKYGSNSKDVLDYFQNIQKEYHLLAGDGHQDKQLEEEVKHLQADLVELAHQLSQQRHLIADKLEADIHRELAELYMEKATFQVHFSTGKFNRQGNEQVEFYLSANPGEGFKPLVKVASGGELSRMMLALKSTFSRQADKTSIVFDEVDTGVSGRVSQAIAQKIHKIGQNGQVLVISHSPQVIAISDHQFFIEKQSSQDATVSTVRLLTTDERIEEIAKLLAGDNVTEAARSQARELLKH
ncbi:DNA repair protein RecN [Streptococcus sp. DD12]|uniref:DNA repair protein RecN n=1 Tax=Streptococcus sp. DD12 TaxID=1777880 RepID=UPI0007916BCC|nr:DNA repair protein RecN [Streptococcus sp. DD12]KXT75342.1 DNA repair protein RecN [Streptococcus sp. DD12]